nr:hypothetical protein [Rubrobacter tropicus]
MSVRKGRASEKTSTVVRSEGLPKTPALKKPAPRYIAAASATLAANVAPRESKMVPRTRGTSPSAWW